MIELRPRAKFVRSQTTRAVVLVTALVTSLSACTSDGDAGSGNETSGAAAGSSTAALPSASTPASAAPTGSVTGIPTAKPPPSSKTTAPPPDPIRTRTFQGTYATYRVNVWGGSASRQCVAHAYGVKVVQFLRKDRCSQLRRLIVTTTVKGRPVGVALARVAFPGPLARAQEVASDLQLLMSQPGAGGFSDLLNDGARLPRGPKLVPASNTSKVTYQDNVVTEVQSWYLAGATPTMDPDLTVMLDDMIQFL